MFPDSTLQEKIDEYSSETAKNYSVKNTPFFDFDKLANDVKPFLYKPEDSLRVKYFLDYLKQ